MLTENDAFFPVEGYLRQHGQRFADRWTPARFLALSLSGDLHRVNPRTIRTPAVIVAAEGDAIVPRAAARVTRRSTSADRRSSSICRARAATTHSSPSRRALGRILDHALSIPILLMSASDSSSPITRAVRAGIATDREHGAVVPPIHLSSTFAFESFAQAAHVRLHAKRQSDALAARRRAGRARGRRARCRDEHGDVGRRAGAAAARAG